MFKNENVGDIDHSSAENRLFKGSEEAEWTLPVFASNIHLPANDSPRFLLEKQVFPHLGLWTSRCSRLDLRTQTRQVTQAEIEASHSSRARTAQLEPVEITCLSGAFEGTSLLPGGREP